MSAAASRSPTEKFHGPDDFDSTATLGPMRPASTPSGHGHGVPYAMGSELADMSPHVSVSKWDGTPLPGPGSPGVVAPGTGYRLAPQGTPPGSPPGSPTSRPMSPPPFAGQEGESVSRFTGRPLGRHMPGEFLDQAMYPPRAGAPGGLLPPGMQPFQTHYLGEPLPPHEEVAPQDCYGGGRALWNVIRSLFSGGRRRPADGVCMYDANAAATTYGEADMRWQFVGQGMGGYEEFRQYRYVGEGLGSVNMLPPPVEPRWRIRPACIPLLFVVAVCVVIVFLFGLVTNSTSVLFDCDTDLQDAQRGWSFEKKAWCCEKEHKGCAVQQSAMIPEVAEEPEINPPSSTTTTVTQSWPMSCDLPEGDDAIVHMRSWSPGQLAYCCLKIGVGCQTTTAPVPYDCEANFLTFDKDWSMSKKVWCCTHQRVGCPNHTPGVQPPPVRASELLRPPSGVTTYNCDLNLQDWEASWSIGKKAFCCEYYAKGCPQVPSVPSEPYNCWAGFQNWQQEWSLPKKIYCCQNQGKGCTQGRSMAPPAATTGCDTNCRYKDEDSTCKMRVSWLVEHEHVKCDAAHTQVQQECPNSCRGCELSQLQCEDPGFDCEADFDNFEAMWSVDQRAWCCKHQGRSCVRDNSFDCNAGYPSNWENGWSLDKKVYCCTHQGKGCQSARPKFGEYDCATGFEAAWSNMKKNYCCNKEGYGCSREFNCHEGEEAEWNAFKKQFCCTRFQKGCAPKRSEEPAVEEESKPVFDCSAGLKNAELGWNFRKKAFCCQTAGQGCPHGMQPNEEAFDCDAAWGNWEMAWSSKKKDFCCRTHGRACKAFDCHAGGEVKHWHVQKVQWCCINENMACSSP